MIKTVIKLQTQKTLQVGADLCCGGGQENKFFYRVVREHEIEDKFLRKCCKCYWEFQVVGFTFIAAARVRESFCQD